ncbi:MAG: hypothetical protein M1835_000848 [Candelina submexicana]|nr:MAG: hypothetical protein M1835_000848 [Candelina submexicana]
MHRRYNPLLLLPIFSFLLSLYSLRNGIHNRVLDRYQPSVPAKSPSFPIWEVPEPEGPLPTPIHKPTPDTPPQKIVDNFPRAAEAKSRKDLPPVPSWNRPPRKHVPEKTPIFVGFDRNWLLLQQTVVGLITAGWPPEDIYVVENTGAMDSNKKGLLSLQNAFYLDHHRLTKIFGVHVISTPTLLNFAQLQNFFLHVALKRKWEYYFWSHMDIITLADEDMEEPYKSMYMRAVDVLRETLAPGYAHDRSGREGRWSIRFFNFDWLALVNAAAYAEVGGFDTRIGFYNTDCDMYNRLEWAGFKKNDDHIGAIYDVGKTLRDLEVLYRRKPKPFEEYWMIPEKGVDVTGKWTSWYGPRKTVEPEEDERDGSGYKALKIQLQRLQDDKYSDGGAARNSWQSKQAGGQGEPYWQNPEGFERTKWMSVDLGRNIYHEKWGTWDCDLRKMGLKAEDAWRVEEYHDPEETKPEEEKPEESKPEDRQPEGEKPEENKPEEKNEESIPKQDSQPSDQQLQEPQSQQPHPESKQEDSQFKDSQPVGQSSFGGQPGRKLTSEI